MWNRLLYNHSIFRNISPYETALDLSHLITELQPQTFYWCFLFLIFIQMPSQIHYCIFFSEFYSYYLYTIYIGDKRWKERDYFYCPLLGYIKYKPLKWSICVAVTIVHFDWKWLIKARAVKANLVPSSSNMSHSNQFPL